MAVKSSSGGLTPASDSLVALIKIMKRIGVSTFCRTCRAAPSGHSHARSIDTTNATGRNRQVENIFFGRFGGGRLALAAQALGEGRFERGNAFVQALVLLARLLRHRLDGVELLALHDIEAVEDAFRLGAHDAFDLLADAVGGARGVGDELAELVEKPACRLRHRFRSMSRRPKAASSCNYGAANS